MSAWPPAPGGAARRAGLDDLSVGILSTYAPTPCGLATFSSALAAGLSATGSNVNVVRIADGAPSGSDRVVGELVNGSKASAAACVELLNQNHVAIVQHEYGIYGGADGDDVVGIIGALDIPVIAVLHTVPSAPTAHQRVVLEQVVGLAARVVVMSASANWRLCRDFRVDRRKVITIPHGATLPDGQAAKRGGRPTLLTWGLLGPGKGIERGIDAMGELRQLNGMPRYLIAGRTHPKVLASEGESYRDACTERARSRGVADAVCFDPGYRSPSSLTTLIHAAKVVLLPYDSAEQVTSGVLVDAIANGRPVVATAFPHAVELLSSGAGIVVDHDDPDGLASALRNVITQPRLAGAMAAEARRLAPSMAWSVVADAYLSAARELLFRRLSSR